jgi:hypothetical protein
VDVQRHRVVVSQTVPLSKPTVAVLLSTLEGIFHNKDKPIRLLYEKGEDLQVEFSVLRPAEEAPELNMDSGLLTPYQVVRQYCDVSVVADRDIGQDNLRVFCKMAEKLRRMCPIISGIILRRAEDLQEWSGTDLSAAFGIPVYEDPDTPKNTIFLCGSTKSTMLRDFESAIAISTGA